MKFAVTVHMQRRDPDESIEEIVERALQYVIIADEAGFEMAWCGEHHVQEYVFCPNPLIQLTQWAAHTKRIRLGTAVLVAPYWHPLRMAGEIGLTDWMTGGRLEVGIARGAFQFEFDRLAGGIPEIQGGEHLREVVPILKRVFEGDYTHDGAIWQFPASTAVPKPKQQPYPPLWVAARSPDTFDWAVKNGLNIMSTPLRQPMSEVANLAQKLETAVAKNPGCARPRWMVSRGTCVYEDPNDWRKVVEYLFEDERIFQGLQYNAAGVTNGFPAPIDLAARDRGRTYTPEALRENLLIGTPDEVVAKIRQYEEAGVDLLTFNINMGLPHEVAMRSLLLLAEEVLPRFAPSA